MLNHNEIAEDAKDIAKAENKGERGDGGDVGEVENAEEVGDAKDAGVKEAGKSNDGAANGRDEKDDEVGKLGDGGEQEAGKMRYDRVDDGVGIGGDLEDIEVGNNSVGDGRNQDNRYATVEDIVDSDDKVIAAVDPTDRIFAKVLAHLFGLSSPQSNLTPGITTIFSD